jgi:hypothetical protein
MTCKLILADKFVEELNHYVVKQRQFKWRNAIIPVDLLHVLQYPTALTSLMPCCKVPVNGRPLCSHKHRLSAWRETPTLTCINLCVFYQDWSWGSSVSKVIGLRAGRPRVPRSILSIDAKPLSLFRIVILRRPT